MKVIFLVKQDCNYGHTHRYHYRGEGLRVSAKFVVDLLNAHRIPTVLAQVVDGNDIDRQMHGKGYTQAVIEALWVTPTKLKELMKLYPRVRWYVRIHSDVPFLAVEGMSMDWIQQYAALGTIILPNSQDLSFALRGLRVANTFLPNFFPLDNFSVPPRPPCGVLNVGCLGSIRPLKNHLQQAMAAIIYSQKANLPLRFHINARVEQGGEEVLKNLRALLGDRLVEVPWLNRQGVLFYIRTLNLMMQVSLTETFDITAADSINQFVPTVGSGAILWLPGSLQANPLNLEDIVTKIGHALGIFHNSTLEHARSSLAAWSQEAADRWIRWAT